MSKIDRLLARGIVFAKEGRDTTARSLFKVVIEEEPKNQLAWGWYVQTFRDEDEQIQAFNEYLHVFPQDQVAQNFQASLLKRQYERWKQVAVDAVQKVDHTEHVLERSEKKSRKTLSVWVGVLSLILIFSICFITLFSLRTIKLLSTQSENLITNYGILEKNYQSLQAAFDTLNNDYSLLLTNYIDLEGRYNNLSADFSDLNDRYSIVYSDYQTLITEYNDLVSKYVALTGEYDRLENISLQPPYISVHNREITMAFYDLKQNLVYWTTPFSNLEYYIIQGNKTRDSMFNRGENVNRLFMDDGASFLTGDYSLYIDTYSFTRVVGSIYNKANSDDEFIREIWQIVGQLSEYASEDEQEIPRFPSETMLAGGGDCEDLSILFASMIMAAPTNWYVDLVYIDADNVLNPQDPNHVIVYIDTGQRTYLVETTNNVVMEPYVNGVRGWLNSQVSSQLASERYPVNLH